MKQFISQNGHLIRVILKVFFILDSLITLFYVHDDNNVSYKDWRTTWMVYSAYVQIFLYCSIILHALFASLFYADTGNGPPVIFFAILYMGIFCIPIGIKYAILTYLEENKSSFGIKKLFIIITHWIIIIYACYSFIQTPQKIETSKINISSHKSRKTRKQSFIQMPRKIKTSRKSRRTRKQFPK
jgi:hypothetical protein